MDLRGMHYFVCIADLGSITRAADHLHVAQPALSRHIRQLEEELSVELFHRTSRGVRLTDAGHHLYEHARRIITDCERARDELQAIAGTPTGSVAFGLPPTVCPVLIPPLMRRLRREAPKIDIRFLAAVTVQLQEWVMDGRIDCAILVEMEEQRLFETTPLVREDLVLVTAPGRPAKPYVTGEELARTPLIMSPTMRRILDPTLKRHGVHLFVETEMGSSETIRLLVQQGLGATLMPYSLVRAECEAGLAVATQITDTPVQRTLLFAVHNKRRPSLATREVQRHVEALVRELESEGTFRIEAGSRQWSGHRALTPVRGWRKRSSGTDYSLRHRCTIRRRVPSPRGN